MEIEGKPEKKEKQNEINSKQEESLSAEIEENKVIISHSNIKKVSVNIFVVDLEELFTSYPFLASANNNFEFL